MASKEHAFFFSHKWHAFFFCHKGVPSGACNTDSVLNEQHCCLALMPTSNVTPTSNISTSYLLSPEPSYQQWPTMLAPKQLRVLVQSRAFQSTLHQTNSSNRNKGISSSSSSTNLLSHAAYLSCMTAGHQKERKDGPQQRKHTPCCILVRRMW